MDLKLFTYRRSNLTPRTNATTPVSRRTAPPVEEFNLVVFGNSLFLFFWCRQGDKETRNDDRSRKQPGDGGDPREASGGGGGEKRKKNGRGIARIARLRVHAISGHPLTTTCISLACALFRLFVVVDHFFLLPLRPVTQATIVEPALPSSLPPSLSLSLHLSLSLSSQSNTSIVRECFAVTHPPNFELLSKTNFFVPYFPLL